MSQRRQRRPGRRPLPPALALALLLALPLGGEARAQRYLIHTYDEGHGLPSAAVRSVAQGPDGRMWLATRGGVVAYDGARWETHGEERGLPVAPMGHLRVDERGSLWAATRYTPIRVARLGGSRWVRLPAHPTELVGQVVSALAVIDHADGPRILAGTSAKELHVWDGERWHSLPLPVARERATVHAIEPRGDAVLVLAGDELLAFDRASLLAGRLRQPLAPALPGGLPGNTARRVLGLCHAPGSGELWVLGRDWVARERVDGFEVHALELATGYPDRYGSTLLAPDGRGGLFFGNEAMLCHVRPGAELRSLTRENGLVTDGTTGLCIDREGNTWVASHRGLSKVVGLGLATFDSTDGLLTDEVSAVLERRDGGMVLGHPGGLTFLGSEPRTLRLSEVPIRGRVLDLLEDELGVLWVAANDMGLASVDAAGELRWHPELTAGQGAVAALHLDRAGDLWVGGARARRDAFGAFRPVADSPLGEAGYVRSIFEDAGGTLYFLSYRGGLYRLRADRSEFLGLPTSLAAESVFCAHQDRAGVIRFGSTAGLLHLASEGLVRAPAADGGLHRPVYSILEDREGGLWFGTDAGVERRDGSERTWLGARDGLGGSEVNRAAMLVDRHGRVWIGTNGGVSVYDRELDARRSVPPTVELLGQGTPAGTRYVPYDQSSLRLSFRAISFLDETRLRFRHRLLGFDEDWVEGGPLPLRRVDYRYLPPGSYRFEIQAIDVAGRSSAIARSERIVVRPPLWERPWFLGLAGVGLLGLVYGGVSHLAQRRYARRLAAEVESRTRELDAQREAIERTRRLESLGTLAGGIAHDFNNLLTAVLGRLSLLEHDAELTIEHRQAVRETAEATLRARALTEQLLTFSRGGAPVRRAASMREVIEDTARLAFVGSRAGVELALVEDLWTVDIDPGQMEQVIGNLLRNAREALPPGSDAPVQVRATNVERYGPTGRSYRVSIEIQDAGRGIAPEHVGRIFEPYFTTKPEASGLGLAIAHSIVEKHEGTLSVESEPGAGTLVRIELPRSRAGVTTPSGAEPGARADLPADGGPILVMDDDPGVRAALEGMLGLLGYRATVTEDGAAALEAWRAARTAGTPFRAVLMDLTVPEGLGGRATMQRLLEQDPGAIGIVVSGYSNDPVIARHREFGFRGRLVKPFRLEDLAEVLASSLAEPLAEKELVPRDGRPSRAVLASDGNRFEARQTTGERARPDQFA